MGDNRDRDGVTIVCLGAAEKRDMLTAELFFAQRALKSPAERLWGSSRTESNGRYGGDNTFWWREGEGKRVGICTGEESAAEAEEGETTSVGRVVDLERVKKSEIDCTQWHRVG